jgi:hypothetical protein
MFVSVTIVPASTPPPGAVQFQPPSPVLNDEPVHSRSEKKIVVPPSMASSAANGMPSLPSARKLGGLIYGMTCSRHSQNGNRRSKFVACWK